MSRKLPGSAIVPGTITVTQITGGLNDTTVLQTLASQHLVELFLVI